MGDTPHAWSGRTTNLNKISSGIYVSLTNGGIHDLNPSHKKYERKVKPFVICANPHWLYILRFYSLLIA